MRKPFKELLDEYNDLPEGGENGDVEASIYGALGGAAVTGVGLALYKQGYRLPGEIVGGYGATLAIGFTFYARYLMNSAINKVADKNQIKQPRS